MKKSATDIVENAKLVLDTEDCLKRVNATQNAKGNKSIAAEFYLFGQRANCNLRLSKTNHIMEQTCDCNWFKDYGDCPHLKEIHQIISKDNIRYPIDYENKYLKHIDEKLDNVDQRMKQRRMSITAQHSKPLLNKFISMYDTQLKLSVDNDVYEIEPVFSNKDNEWGVTFKVGNEKKYVIKSITAFLDNIDEHIEVAYGKMLRFVHSEEKFEENSAKCIPFLRKYAAAQTNYNEAIKSISLSGNCLDDFFSLYENEVNGTFVLESVTDCIPVEASLQGDYYVFHLDTAMAYHFGNKYVYYSQEIGKSMVINRILLDEQGITALFLSQLYEEDIVITKEDYTKFYQYVLMTAMQYIDISLPTQLNDEQMDHAELYGDIDEQNRIYFYLYCYNTDNERYNGFDTQRLISYDQVRIESYIKKYALEVDEKSHMVYMDENLESTLEFISEGLPYLSEYCQIYVSDALKSIGKSQKYNIQIGVRFKNNLLSLNIDSDNIPKEELAAVLASYKRKKKFYRLKNGKLLSLQSDDLAELDSFLDDYHLSHNDLTKGKIEMEPYRMFSLAESNENQNLLNIQREQSFVSHIQSYYEEKHHKIPKHYTSILRDYQKDGFQWLSVMRQYAFNGILADDMGLGKTLQVIALLEANKGKCSIVICPASLIYNWEEEVHKFSKELSIACVTGTQEERKEHINKYTEVDLLVTSYDYIKRDIEYYSDIQFDTVILDEAQYIKNQKTKNALSVKQLQASHRLALTGTPIENSLAELWSIFDFLMPNYLFNYHYFQKQYENDIVRNKDEEKQKALQRLVSPFILRRNKKDVLKELPDKIETVRLIEFNPEEKKLYAANVAQVTNELKMMDDSKSNRMQILAMLTKLRQLCCEPRLVYENVHQLSSKLMDCMDLIEELNQNHQKILLFSTFTSILDLIAEELQCKQISFYKLTGKVSKEDRRTLVDKFQNDNTSVFLISLKAGGTGLNLTAAEAVIHYDPWWNQSAQSQATDRAYRIGQNKNVQVFKMIMKDSIEEKILKLQEQKKALADAFVENNEGSITSMNKEEIMELFKA